MLVYFLEQIRLIAWCYFSLRYPISEPRSKACLSCKHRFYCRCLIPRRRLKAYRWLFHHPIVTSLRHFSPKTFLIVNNCVLTWCKVNIFRKWISIWVHRIIDGNFLNRRFIRKSCLRLRLNICKISWITYSSILRLDSLRHFIFRLVGDVIWCRVAECWWHLEFLLSDLIISYSYWFSISIIWYELLCVLIYWWKLSLLIFCRRYTKNCMNFWARVIWSLFTVIFSCRLNSFRIDINFLCTQTNLHFLLASQSFLRSHTFNCWWISIWVFIYMNLFAGPLHAESITCLES